ncbi:serine/threonine-protein kinase [Paraliomyxa miuraensis]|uniref:serine/threonine-protein kinase n=1 Tax=Paraliomyxa miuraensis TaxID=376150 RepID=UPI00225419CA|nr:serine/threonine-protein kinase [Paraliomyxa miuraensis]MCX4247390.1 serine/threonine protein kinase [Paraliomyxa miuraensis]
MAQPGSEADPTTIGRYRVEGQLGAGGVGMVYAAHDPVLERRVAVKLLRSDRLETMAGPAGDRLREEAQAMARLAHPNVVTVYDVGEHEGGVYIAMELVEGRSLRGWIGETARPWREVLSAYFQAGRGLAAAHDVGLVHRDFKPGNVLMGRDGRVRVLDFGLAMAGPGGAVLVAEDADAVDDTCEIEAYHRQNRITEVETTVDESGKPSRGEPERRPVVPQPRPLPRTDVLATLEGAELTVEGSIIRTMGPNATNPGAPPGLSGSGIIAGTPAYMAPEVFLGRPADARSDQFSFCVALFEGLYGYRPFVGSTPEAIRAEVLAGRMRPPPSRSRVPRFVHAAVMQGLARHRQDRHASVRSMLASIAFLARVIWD